MAINKKIYRSFAGYAMMKILVAVFHTMCQIGHNPAP